MAQEPQVVTEEMRPRQGFGTRIFNFVRGVLYGPPKPHMRRRDPKKTQGAAPSYASGEEGQNLYSFYGERMRLGKTRMEIYDEVDLMDSDDLPSAVLDTYTEDAIQLDPATNRVLWVEDCDEEIRAICEDCIETTQLEEYGYLIARNLGKYGDFPVELFWEPGVGITLLRYHHPKRFRRFEDYDTGSLIGYYLGETAGGASEPNKQPWELVHFRIFGSLSAMYGTTLLVSSRRPYRRLRMAEDADVVYILQRHADRDVYYVDCTGLTDEETSDYIQRFTTKLKKQKYYDPNTGQLREDWNPWTANEDLVVPQIQGRETKIERLKGSSNANEATNLHYYLARYHASVRIPPSFFGYNIEGSTPYDPSRRLTQQDSRYVRIPQKLQRYFLLGVHRILQLNLAFRGIDPRDPANKFTLVMAPVSFLEELHRQQLIEIRIDIIDRLLNLGQQVGFDMSIWIRYVLKQYGHLSDRLIDELIVPGQVQPGTDAAEGTGAPPPPPPQLPGPEEAPAGGATPPPPPEEPPPIPGAEFEKLNPALRPLLVELVSRISKANQMMESRRVRPDQARHFFVKDLQEDWFGDDDQEKEIPTKESSGETYRTEDHEDLVAKTDDEDEDEA